MQVCNPHCDPAKDDWDFYKVVEFKMDVLSIRKCEKDKNLLPKYF